MAASTFKYKNRELSWLSFNERVLQEANDPTVPLLERLKFLGIFSSNLDEFFRVRVAVLKRMSRVGRRYAQLTGGMHPDLILANIQDTVIKQRLWFDEIYAEIRKKLEDHQIFMINETELSAEQGIIVKSYFETKVRPSMTTIILNKNQKFPYLKDMFIYLIVQMKDSKNKKQPLFAIIEVPANRVSRFFVLPEEANNKQMVILLDDIIRYCLKDVFFIFDYDQFEAYTIKLTRDAELDIDSDSIASYIEKLSKSLKQRQKGQPVRFIYDKKMPPELLEYVKRGLHLRKDDAVIGGGRYHNFKDFMKFPKIGPRSLRLSSPDPIRHRHIPPHTSILQILRKRDIMIHYPYESFDHVIYLIREASLDPNVDSISMTLYRVAEESKVVTALINAVKNGKKVMVVMELQARFDEEANIYWANKLAEEGARVIYGVPGYKVHSKLCLITRKEDRRRMHYAYIGTGNFNEDTARLYCDDALLTAYQPITREVAKVFEFLDDNTRVMRYRHLLVSPHYMRSRLLRMINQEIRHAKEGKTAYMHLKMNSLVDRDMVKKLNEAAAAGVEIKLIVRGMCSLVPDEKLPIEIYSIVDKYLEHSRVFIFANGGEEAYFISSADMMRRNLDHRVEVATPIYDKGIQKELRDMFDIQLSDNVKSRILSENQDNTYRHRPANQKKVRAQDATYEYIKNLT